MRDGPSALLYNRRAGGGYRPWSYDETALHHVHISLTCLWPAPAIRAGRAGTIDFAGIAAAGAPLGRNADTGRGELPTALSVANRPASGSVVTRERSKMTPGMAAV